MIEHKETCLEINDKKTVKLKNGSIKFKSCFKQLAVPFKINADFESLLKGVRINDNKIILHKLKNIRNTFFCSFAYKVVCIDNKFSKLVVLYRGKNAINRFIEKILEEYDDCKKVIKKAF